MGEGRVPLPKVRGCVLRKAEAVAADVPEATAENYVLEEGQTGAVSGAGVRREGFSVRWEGCKLSGGRVPAVKGWRC